MSDAFLLNLTEKILTENKKLKGTLSAKYRQGQKAGEREERERIIKLLKQLESEWKGWLGYYMEIDNSYEISRYRNYILACSDLRDMVQDPDALIKGEQK